MTDKDKIRNIIELFIAWNGETDVIDIANIDSAVDFISDSLQVKEVDLEKEIQDIFQKYKNGYNGLLICKKEDFSVIAKHFFELGLNASNPLTWEDIKTIQNISHEVYEEVAKGKDDFYLIYPTEQSFLEEVLKRFKAQKGE